MRFDYDLVKNELLLDSRGVSFDDVIESIDEHGVLLDFPHPNVAKYPDQRILVVNLNGYPYCVPYVRQGGALFLKTIFPSRKFKSLLEGDPDAQDE